MCSENLLMNFFPSENLDINLFLPELCQNCFSLVITLNMTPL